ncbi:MAG: hypothetical protein IJP03_03695 [Christensenellaceae bacterium]|nr:hypothetical protein [Christensenellaceae bacterium]
MKKIKLEIALPEKWVMAMEVEYRQIQEVLARHDIPYKDSFEKFAGDLIGNILLAEFSGGFFGDYAEKPKKQRNPNGEDLFFEQLKGSADAAE